MIVEQNSAIRVTDDHAVGQFGHDGGQAMVLLFQVSTRLADALVAIALQALEFVGKLVQRGGEGAQRSWALRRGAAFRIGVQDQLGFIVEIFQLDEIGAKKAVQPTGAANQEEGKANWQRPSQHRRIDLGVPATQKPAGKCATKQEKECSDR